MTHLRKKIESINLLNVDGNVLLSLLNSIWTIAKTPITLLLITSKLDSTTQGYWYTFLSLGALSVFAEMGFTTIVTQFLSYEFANLSLDKNNLIIGENSKVERFISLVQYTFKKYLKIIPIGIGIILLIGFIFFRKDLYNDDVRYCWLIYSLTGGTSLFLSLLSSILKGINKVKYALQIIFIINLINTITVSMGLILGFGLWSLSLSAIIAFCVSLILIYLKFNLFFKQIFSMRLFQGHDWNKEISALQIKYSVSWIAGYFIFSFVVPATMYFLGPTEAGKVGITISLGAALLQMSHSWVANKMPELNMLISLGEKYNAKKMFSQNNKSSLLFFIMSSTIIVVFFYFNVFAMLGFGTFESKFISIYGIIVILIAEFFKLLLGNWAVYLRAYKEEPFLKITVINSIFTVLTFCIILSIFKTLLGALIIFALIQIISVLVGKSIFNNRFD